MTQPFEPRTVACPTCGGPARYAPENRWRPFCSERCRQIDLGGWASERFRIPDPPPNDALPTSESDTWHK